VPDAYGDGARVFEGAVRLEHHRLRPGGREALPPFYGAG
jgi:hypothetical protein